MIKEKVVILDLTDYGSSMGTKSTDGQPQIIFEKVAFFLDYRWEQMSPGWIERTGLLSQVLQSLLAIQANRLIYRDVTAQNILRLH